MKNSFFSYRLINLYALLFILAILGYALYTQYYQNLNPCPLCILQRIVFCGLGFIFLLGSIYKASQLGRKLLHGLGFIFSVIGIGLAGRQIYLQHLPSGSVPSCGPSFNFIVQNLPFKNAIPLLLQGSGECALVPWRFLGLSMSEWSLLFFFLLAILHIFQIYNRRI